MKLYTFAHIPALYVVKPAAVTGFMFDDWAHCVIAEAWSAAADAQALDLILIHFFAKKAPSTSESWCSTSCSKSAGNQLGLIFMRTGFYMRCD